jgi:60 kDa SS-A/Ro ribonucleoprotein
MKLQRFLILSTENGTYYVGEQKLTLDNAKNIEKLIRENGKKVVDVIVEISDAGRAAKNDAALFALAMCAGLGNEETRKYALENLPKVARIGTHLFHFAAYVQQFRGWGHGLRKAIANWYIEKTPQNLAFQLVKYQGRDGWSNKDLIKLSHPVALNSDSNLALRWSIDKMGKKKVESINIETLHNPFGSEHTLKVPGKTSIRWETDENLLAKEMMQAKEALPLIYAFEQLKKETSESKILSLVKEYRMPLEAIPTEKQTDAVLEQALPNLGITALIRNLGRYTSKGLFAPMNSNTKLVVNALTNIDLLKKGRVHPISLLSALMVYKSGQGFKGSLAWSPISAIVDALDEAFYLAFGIIVPTGKNIMLALDVSGSMGGSMINGLPYLSARAGSAAMAMVTARTEKNFMTVAFTNGGWESKASGRGQWPGYKNGITEIDISPKQRLDAVVAKISNLPFGGTDCALPMLYATAKNLEIDCFITYTDSETFAGGIHPTQALQEYRKHSGRPARAIVVGMASNDFSIADPTDAGQLDIVGFDTNAPQVMSDFILGKV